MKGDPARRTGVYMRIRVLDRRSRRLIMESYERSLVYSVYVCSSISADFRTAS
ncbi:MAG: hypothetical protein LBJ92_03820 [Holosporales bacterium]|nr:hypothetical protein [Holosporales bacterium]